MVLPTCRALAITTIAALAAASMALTARDAVGQERAPATSARCTVPAEAASVSPAGKAQQAAPVIASGTVPDEATKSAVLGRLSEIYGAERVVDRIAIGAVYAPANWSADLTRVLAPGLKQISHGELAFNGESVTVRGDVANEAQRQQIASDLANNLKGNSYTVTNALRVAAAEQNLLDKTLANRTVEFESGSATLALRGRAILDEMTAALSKIGGKNVELIGHTDDLGQPATNLALSQARAEAVKAYLVGKGLKANTLTTSGRGSDCPLMSNRIAEGRARNRRIEFLISS